jgi:hypothetical protein
MNDSPETNLELMNKRRELMEDKRRYIIYYTFGADDEQAEVLAEKEPNRNKADK